MENNSDFNDRKGFLVFFGVVKIIFGIVFFLFCLFYLFSFAVVQNINADPAQQVSAASIIAGSVVYLLLAAVFITLGIGSIKKTRWARSLTLLFSWITSIVGIIMSIVMAFTVDDIFNNINTPELNNPGILFLIKVFIFAFIIFFLIIIPAIFILFYRSRSVIKTVQKYDTKERWTDRCPLPLLALCFFLLYGSVLPLFMISTGFVIPFFGTFLSGVPAALLLVLNSIVSIYLAINIYKLNTRSWYYSLYLLLFWVTSFLITLIFNNYMDIYKYMNIPSAQLTVIENTGLLTNKSVIVMSLPSILLCLIFFFYIKKFFKDNNRETGMTLDNQIT